MRRPVPLRGGRGFSLIELLIAVAILATLTAAAVPPVLRSLETRRVRTAAFALRALLQEARGLAASRAAHVAVVFDPPSGGGGAPLASGASGSPVIGLYRDGNHNGVRRAEIAAGIDPRLRNPWSFEDRFPGVSWGAPAGEPGGEGIPGLAVGFAEMVSFSPLGSSGAGRITVSRAGTVISVVIHGGSSRIRLERRSGSRWVPA